MLHFLYLSLSHTHSLPLLFSLSLCQNYNERMAKTNRPVSPHVTIYQFPMGALTSITNRVTGVALSVGCLGVASLELVSSGMTQQILTTVATSGGPVLGGMAKFTVGFPLVYHYLGGVRHLVWDYFPDQYLNNVDVEKASYVLVGGSLVLSLGLAVV